MGEVIITDGAAHKLLTVDVATAIARHTREDWGNLDPEDKRLNDEAVKKGGPLTSIYRDSKGVKFYVITEANRSATTVLLP